MALFGPPDVEKLKTKKNVKGLIKALNFYEDKEIRKKAACALGSIKDRRAIDPLISSALYDKEKIVRKNDVDALWAIGREKTIALLIKKLQNTTDSIYEIASTLSETGSKHVAKSLAKMIPETSSLINRSGIIKALDKLNWQPKKDELGAYYWIEKGEWHKCIEIGTSAIKPLISKSMSGLSCPEAVKALGVIGDSQAVDGLITLLDHDKSDMTNYAAEALGKTGDKRAIKPLLKILQEKYSREIADALERLGWQPDESKNGAFYWISKKNWNQCVKIGAPAIFPLIDILKSYKWSERKAAAIALVKIYHSGMIDATYKQMILSHKSKITEEHVDGKQHRDGTSYSDCNEHRDSHVHGDRGIGINFHEHYDDTDLLEEEQIKIGLNENDVLNEQLHDEIIEKDENQILTFDHEEFLKPYQCRNCLMTFKSSELGDKRWQECPKCKNLTIKTKPLVTCPSCKEIWGIPIGKVGKLKCSRCSHIFKVNT